MNFGQAALAAPVSIPVKVAEGNFRGVAHETKGMAAVYKLPDGKNVLRFSAFETSNGPDVHIYLVAANDAKDDETVKKQALSTSAAPRVTSAIRIMALPAGVDFSKYRAVTVV